MVNVNVNAMLFLSRYYDDEIQNDRNGNKEGGQNNGGNN